ncbi:MAG: LysM peptidoglycan-binding domain-containing protein, partial [Anaerolineae bacterium]|nr:LysM peptidoglycan-binding domain-containing protein [Anaerolineae bacterium]
MKTRLLLVVVVIVLVTGFAPAAQADPCATTTHIVKAGENLTQIARMYGVTVDAIVRANNLWNPNVIYVGQCLIIPVPCTPPAPGGCTKIHVVQRGEYLKRIAARYGTTVDKLVALNNIRNPNLIYPGQRLKVPVPCPGPSPTPAPSTGPWTCRFWNNRFMSGDPKFEKRYQTIDFNWGTAGPGGGIGGTNFAVRCTRDRDFNGAKYRFYTRVDDGVRVWVDGELIIGQWHDTAPKTYSTDKQIASGKHQLQIDYYQNTGGAQLQFWTEQLDGATVWKGEFHNNPNLDGSPTVTKQYGSVDFNWGNKAPVQGVNADYFSARFTGTFHFAAGKYRFSATSDDGIRVYVDGHKVIDEWHLSAPTTYYGEMDIGEGNHEVKVEYFENQG